MLSFYYFAIGDTATGTVWVELLRTQILSEVAITKMLRTIEVRWNRGNVIVLGFASALSPADETALGAVVSAHDGSQEPGTLQDVIRATLVSDTMTNVPVSTVVAGLQITTNIDGLIINDITIVVADPLLTKYIRLSYVYHEDTDTFTVEGYERTDGEYAPYGPPDYLVRELGEWYVVANGTTLVPV